MLPLLLFLTLLAPPAQDAGPAPPPPRQRVAGKWGVVMTSLIDSGDDDGRHRLEVSYAFPQRARSALTPVGGRPSQRRLTFRYGEGLWTLAAGRVESQALGAGEDAVALRELALRRALVLWPEGHDWRGERGERFADLGQIGGQVLALRAVLPAEDARPTAIEVIDDEGRPLESMTGITWRTVEGRTWPVSLVMRRGGRLLWREQVERVLEARLSDSYFLPPDRRQLAGDALRLVRAFDLPAKTVRRVELEAGLDLPAALARADALIGEARRVRGTQRIDASPHLELDALGRPLAVWILWAGEGAAPEGWTPRPARSALGLFLAGVEACGARERGELARAAARAGAVPGSLFLRVRPSGEAPRRAELVLVLGG